MKGGWKWLKFLVEMLVLGISGCDTSGYDKILTHSFPKKETSRALVIATYLENVLASVFTD
jgi:hypothetical protein